MWTVYTMTACKWSTMGYYERITEADVTVLEWGKDVRILACYADKTTA